MTEPTDLPPDDPRHGTRHAYNNLACRCTVCRAACAAYAAQRRIDRGPLAPDDPRHGTTGGYTNHGCRCGSCRAANTALVTMWRRRRGVAVSA